MRDDSSIVEPRPSPRPWLALWRAERGTFAQLPLMARGLFAEILKLTDDDGVVDIGNREPAAAIAWALGANRSDRRLLEKYLPMLIEDGCLVHSGDRLIAPSFARWQPQVATPKRRTAVADETTKRSRTDHDNATTAPRSSHDSATTGSRQGHETEAKCAETHDPVPDVVEESREEKSRVEENKTQKGRKRPPVVASEVEREVFEHWRSKLGKSERSQLDAKRLGRIQWALEAYGLEAVKRCIDGYSRSPHHLGQNDRQTRFDDIELFLRDAKHVEAGLAMAERGPRPANGNARMAPVEVDPARAKSSVRKALDLFGSVGAAKEAVNG